MQSHEIISKPFLKWPGGKRWLSKRIAEFIRPHLQNRYWEPFLGGGAVFFELRPRIATLSDVNPDLINAFKQVRDQPLELIKKLKRMPISETHYYKTRSEAHHCLIKRAAAFLYLNRTAFGGIYRVNRQGKFNVPFGGGERTTEILWKDCLLKSSSEILKGVSLLNSDFEPIMDQALSGDVIFCDPTYTVAHENNGFVRYNERNFSWNDQERLATAALRAYKKGIFVVITNAYHPSIRNIYKGFRTIKIARKSLVSTNLTKRRLVHEYLIILDPTKNFKAKGSMVLAMDNPKRELKFSLQGMIEN